MQKYKVADLVEAFIHDGKELKKMQGVVRSITGNFYNVLVFELKKELPLLECRIYRRAQQEDKMSLVVKIPKFDDNDKPP